jgi:riboflavin biosynthesis pyrimidine reductase
VTALQRLYPDPDDLPLAALYHGLTLTNHTLAVCMVSSFDGSATYQGISGGLGGPADLLALSRLRAANDVSLVGAATVRDEDYVPLTGTPERQADRTSRGLRPAPRLAIVTVTGMLDPNAKVFQNPDERPLVLVPEGVDTTHLTDVADIIRVGSVTAGIDPVAIRQQLTDLGLHRILLEGGPRLNAAFALADQIDECFVTIAPTMVSGTGRRMIETGPEVHHGFRVASVFLHGGDLLLRYVRDTHLSPASSVE